MLPLCSRLVLPLVLPTGGPFYLVNDPALPLVLPLVLLLVLPLVLPPWSPAEAGAPA